MTFHTRLAYALVLVPALLLGATAPAAAGPFEITVSPSRFELRGKSGARIEQILSIENASNTATQVDVRTIDWTYSANGDLGLHDELMPDSCRPWITLERAMLAIPAHGKRTFRVQVDVPAAAVRGECRLMIAVEGTEPAVRGVISSGDASLSLPVIGRLAVPVYLQVNGAQPKLELRQVATRDVKGTKTSYITVVNNGDAHGRVEGSLYATDSRGRSFELVPEGTPIMPAQTRTLALVPQADDADAGAVPYTYPFTVSGTLDWDRGSFEIDQELP